MSHEIIANLFHCSERTVRRVIQNQRERGNNFDSPRSGRPSKINDRGLRHLKKIVDNDRRQTLGNITNTLNTSLASPVSSRTVKRALNTQFGLSSHHARQKPFLKEVHILKRKDWAKEAAGWRKEEWGRIIWTDESSVELGESSYCPLVWRTSNEEYDRRCLVPTFKSGRSSVMVWGAIAYNWKGPLVIIPKDQRKGEDYARNILGGPLWDAYQQLSEERGLVKVMEDNAPVHTCRVAKEFRVSHGMETLPHPAQSPDMNPIEHVWGMLKKRVNARGKIPENVEELGKVLMEEWDKISLNKINSLIDSMSNRVQELIDSEGLSTRF